MSRQIWLHDEDRSNPYLTNQVRRSGSPRPKNARARLEQEEKREAIKASAQAAKQSNTPSRETKLDQVGASIAKYSGKKSRSSANKPVTRSQTKNSSPGSSNQNLNHFSQEINATYLSSPTDILYSPHSFAHCISADLAMAKGLARQVKSWYPAAPSAIRLRYPPDIGSVLIYFDPISERYIFSLVTKFRYYHKPTYESVLASLYELKEIVIDAGISHLSLPKLASGYDKLDFNIIFELICQVFDPLPITIYAEKIDRLANSFNSLNDYVKEIGAQTDEKFFLVADELAKVYKVQNEMQENQNRNWKLVEEQFAIVDHNLNALATCMEIQLSQQQLNFNFDTAASLLLTLYADIKSYRADLYSFRINVINAIPTLLDKRLPISSVPLKSLIKILDAVHDSQKNAPDRLTLAIPMTDILSYYDAKLVQEISTVEDGLLLTLAIPLASSQTVFEVYRAIVIPMPQKDSVDALRYVIEGEYLAISEGQMETTVLTKAQYDNCLGSPRYRICHETIDTHLGFSSCLATLKFHHSISALKVCDREGCVTQP